jgi:hypothetical protein
VPAVATALPDSRPQFCQAHYLRTLAEPLAAADAAFTGALRHPVRQQVGTWLRQEPPRSPGHAGLLLTVTGVFPSPGEEPTAPAGPGPAPSATPTTAAPEAEQVITQLVRHTRYLLTLTGRSPLRLAGIEPYERLSNVAGVSRDLLATPYEPRLAQLSQGLQAALAPFAETSQTLHQGAAWLPMTLLTSSNLWRRTPAMLKMSRGNDATIATRYSSSLRSPRPSRRLAVTSTSAVGAIGPVCSTVRTWRACRGPIMRLKATFVRRVAVCCGPRANRGKRSGRCNASAPGNCCPTRRQKPSDRRPCVKPHPRTWLKSGSVVLHIASGSACRVDP